MTNDHIRPLKIIVYTDAAGVGGAEISLRHLVAHASKSVEITVIGVDPQVIATVTGDRHHTQQFVLPRSMQRSILAHRLAFQRQHPDIIHFNLCTPWASAIGQMAALSLPQVRLVRVDQLPLRTTDAVTLWRTRALALRVDAHVAVGKASARRMEDFYALGRDTVISIPNGVPDYDDVLDQNAMPGQVDAPIARPWIRDKSLDAQPLIVGSIGRLDAMKAHDILLRAIALVDGVHVVILGDGAQRSTLEQLANELSIRDRVHWLGWVNQPRCYLPYFDVVAMPSRSEGFPLAMVEAMLAARPVIATRVGSMPEAIISDQTGFLTEKNDVLGLANAIQNLRDHPNLRVHLGRQARERAVTHYTATIMTDRYERLWHHILTLPRKPRLKVEHPKD